MTNNKFYLIAVLLTLGMVGFSCPAMAQSDRNGDVKNRWSVHAAVNLSHRCENPVLWNLDTNELIFGNARFGWGVGAMVGGNYDIRFNRT